jgi:Golgi apparatus protein 1
MDFRSDPMLYEACKDDATSLCKDTKNGGGRIQACLRDKRMQLTWACEEQLFRQEMENADDVRLSVRLFSKCMPDKMKFCKEVEPGNARSKECLEENKDDLSSACKGEIDAMIERRVRDFRLDSKLRKSCENEIFNMCAYFGDLDNIDTYDSSVINCLQDYTAEIKSEQCKKQVKKYVTLASQDIRFDVSLAEACFEDRQKLCASVAPGSARVIRCLTNQRSSLSPVCRATLFDEEVRFSENIDFQFPMKEACKEEIEKFCKDIPRGNGRVIRCLQDMKNEKNLGKPCQQEVLSYESEINKDYRLNYRLRTACQQDIQNLCPTVCQQSDGQVCGGKVLRCLSDKIDNIKAESCIKEVNYFEKMEVSNFKNDVILAEACRQDVDKFCATVEPGDGRVHKCLRDQRKELTEACRKEELLLEEKEANSIELNMGLMKSCKPERQMFCKAVQVGQARVFRCLAENMNDADFGNNCKYQIIYKLQRRQANWKLDPPLRKACRSDVNTFCIAEDRKDSEEGLVYKCMISKFADLTSGCQKELGRAVHMAFFVWQPGAVLTQGCDDDINRLCLSKRPNMAQRPGAIGSCLASIVSGNETLTVSISFLSISMLFYTSFMSSRIFPG